GLVAGAAGVALLLGGSTFAYWSDSTQETVGTITNGVLSVSKGTGAVKAFDLRDDKQNSETDYESAVGSGTSLYYKVVNLSNFKAVPGDTIEIDIPFTLVAVGDNMKYDVDVQVDGPSIDLSTSGWTAEARLYKGSGVTAGEWKPFTQIKGTSGTTGFTTLVSGVTETTGTSGAAYTLVIKATLPGATVTDKAYQNEAAAFGTLNLKVQQVTI
ncbi:MAG: SipW-dependent-type signal peptide-containing protein, partial [Bifidobacteriaceae bacterium]|nr:SipW-dependent-type signal peptide-containing protein [Bifidobacteriaceae bacterium]